MGKRIYILAILAVLVATVAALYAPYVTNPPVFDDHNIITNQAAYVYAQAPFSTATRGVPYFLIGMIHVVSDGDLTWNRWAGIVLHALVAVALYFFLFRTLARLSGETSEPAKWATFCCCLWFALNPAAVYAAGYLIQRSIVMATLFAIVAINLYLRAQEQHRNADLFSAALLSGMAMMCKEHAVLVPVAAITLTPLVCIWNRSVLIRAAVFFVLSFPVSVWILMSRAGVVGTSYEIYAGQVLSQIDLPDLFNFSGGVWAMSIGTQLGLFWKYALLWFLPLPSLMSADMRVDFSAYWQSNWAYIGACATVIAGVVAIYVLVITKKANLQTVFGAVFLFVGGLYCVELSVVRIQEPFVLYRSYLWAPAYAVLLGAVLVKFANWQIAGNSVAWKVFRVVIPFGLLSLYPLAYDRLKTFSSEAALWQDAYAKLASPEIPGADRVYYNLAGEAYKEKHYETALYFSDRVIKQNPGAFHGYLAKGTSLLALNDLDGAERAFDLASSQNLPAQFSGYIEFKRCLVLEARGETDSLIECLKRSGAMGYNKAYFRLQTLTMNTSTLRW